MKLKALQLQERLPYLVLNPLIQYGYCFRLCSTSTSASLTQIVVFVNPGFIIFYPGRSTTDQVFSFFFSKITGCQCIAYTDGQIEVLSKRDHFDHFKHNNSNWYANNLNSVHSCFVLCLVIVLGVTFLNELNARKIIFKRKKKHKKGLTLTTIKLILSYI